MDKIYCAECSGEWQYPGWRALKNYISEFEPFNVGPSRKYFKIYRELRSKTKEEDEEREKKYLSLIDERNNLMLEIEEKKRQIKNLKEKIAMSAKVNCAQCSGKLQYPIGAWYAYQLWPELKDFYKKVKDPSIRENELLEEAKSSIKMENRWREEECQNLKKQIEKLKLENEKIDGEMNRLKKMSEKLQL